MLYQINFKKTHKDFIKHSAIANFIIDSVKQTPMYRHSEKSPNRRIAFDIGMIATLESCLKHNIPLSALSHTEISYLITNENSQDIINSFKSITNKPIEERTQEDKNFLQDIQAVISRISLIVHKYYLMKNDKKGRQPRDLLQELKQEFLEYSKNL